MTAITPRTGIVREIKVFICLVMFSLYPEYCLADRININDIQEIINSIEEESNDLVGGAVAIITNEQVIYKRSFGQKEINGAPIDDNTLFGLASVSKAVTATALGVLVEKNIIQFEDKVNIHGIKLSLKDILSNTTGYKIRGDHQIEKGATRGTLLDLLKKEGKIGIKINKSYFYSNIVYSLAQEYALSKGYTIDKLIGMLNIPFATLPVVSKNLAFPHSKEKIKLIFPSNYQKVVPASAGVFSSLNGMIEFLHIVLGNRPNIISKQTLNQLFTPIAKADDVFNWNILPFKNNEVISSYCLGWRRLTLNSTNRSTLLFHSGYINGVTAFIGIIPESEVGMVILANQSSGGFPLKNGLKLWKAIAKTSK